MINGNWTPISDTVLMWLEATCSVTKVCMGMQTCHSVLIVGAPFGVVIMESALLILGGINELDPNSLKKQSLSVWGDEL